VGHQKVLAITLSAMLLGSVAFVSAAFADGAEKPPAPATPLDKAIDQIETKQPPIVVAPPAPEPVIEQTPPPAPVSRIIEVQPNTSFFGLSIGAYDPMTHGQTAAALSLEWQPGVRIVGVLQPLFGAFVTSRGSTMGYGGVGTPIHFGKHIFIMPSFAVGAYGKGGGVDLGRVLAFRAGTELAYEFDDKSRIGLNIHAISNGESLKRKDRTEIISLVYTIPFNLFSGKPKAVAMPASAVMIAPAAQPADQAIDNSLRK
jgi:lipid A 3-O-deacylase